LNRIQDYLRAHWRGGQAWGLILVVNLLAVRFLLSAAPARAIGVPFLALSMAILIWQVVGGFRAAERGLWDTGNLMRALALYGGILTVIVMAALQGFDVVSARIFVPETPVNKVASPFPLGADNRVMLAGKINYAAYDSLVVTLAMHPDITGLSLDSKGGNIFAARAMALVLRQKGMDTVVNNSCFSACTIVFLAGRNRAIGPDGKLGFHGYAFDGPNRVQTLDIADEEARDRAVFRRIGIAADFLDRAFAVRPPALWIPSRAVLLKAGVISP